MLNLKRILSVLLIGLAVAACLPPAPTSAPPPTDTAQPANTSAPPVEPSPTTAVERPEAIQIDQPGPGSRLTSPVLITGVADPTFEQTLAVTILNVDGAVVAESFTQINADVGQRGPFSVEAPYTLAQEQQGFIQIYAVSAKDGGITHLSSVGVLLLPGGSASIEPALERPEQIVILQPEMGALISGGSVHVAGFGVASFEQTFLIEVLDENGAVIGSTPVTVDAPDLGQPGAFSADIAYGIGGQTAGRVQVRDISPAHGDNTHLASVEVRLEP